jgi:AcrR family transcriptional regulator
MPLTERTVMAAAEGPRRGTSVTARPVAERLEEALADMTRGADAGEPHGSATVAALCRRAGVSRNSVYRYHPDVLETLRQLNRREGGTNPGKSRRPGSDPRPDLKSLQAQLIKLAALVDHYYSAYRETQALLERREREIAELRRSGKSPIQLLR